MHGEISKDSPTRQFGVPCASIWERTLTWDGEQFEIGPRSLLLLAELARARGEVVEREARAEAVWGTEAVISDNALDARVSVLRRELIAVTGQVAVQSLKGRGFALRIAGANC